MTPHSSEIDPNPSGPAAGHDTATPSPGGGHTVGSGAVPAQLPAKLGRYLLLSLLGQGGMGAVYLADDTHLSRRVAFKVPHLAGSDPDGARVLRDRFLREARLAASLTHPNLCPVHDCGEIDGVLYMAMAYLEGKPLAKFIRRGQPLPVRAVVAVVRQLAVAMHEAHSQGVIHRDLKPGNIMVTPSRQPVIMDFGLARRTDIEDTRLTRSGLVLGTPAYMPPEQLNCDQTLIGPATDIYALGVILYELLAGRPPFQGPLGGLMAQIMLDQPPPLARWRADLDPALDRLCGRALAKVPSGRYASMQTFANALEDYLHAPVQPAVAPKPPPPRPPAPAPAAPPKAGPPAPLDEENAATLFNQMAAQQVRMGRPIRPQAPPRRRTHRRRRFRMPTWLPSLIGSLAALAVGGLALGLFVNHFANRPNRSPEQISEVKNPESPPNPGPSGQSPPVVQDSPAESGELERVFERLRHCHPSAYRDNLEALRKCVDDEKRLQSAPAATALDVGKYLAVDEYDWDRAAKLIHHSRSLGLVAATDWTNAIDMERATKSRTATGRTILVAAVAWNNLARAETDARLRPKMLKLVADLAGKARHRFKPDSEEYQQAKRLAERAE